MAATKKKGIYANHRTHTKGYEMTYAPERANGLNNGYVFSHILIAEKALVRELPQGAQVHHFDGDKTNNISNLVICQDAAYHKFLHKRMTALKETGDSNKRKCVICGQWDNPSTNGLVVKKNGQARHKACHAIDMNARYNARERE